mmetsp:Transcript_100702/g.260111  ORF Transcript_100702/g.260111 Transcript_100702/m.260111 type:complete len:230 (-) Transcript_100702:1584-2273(-)
MQARSSICNEGSPAPSSEAYRQPGSLKQGVARVRGCHLQALCSVHDDRVRPLFRCMLAVRRRQDLRMPPALAPAVPAAVGSHAGIGSGFLGAVPRDTFSAFCAMLFFAFLRLVAHIILRSQAIVVGGILGRRPVHLDVPRVTCTARGAAAVMRHQPCRSLASALRRGGLCRLSGGRQRRGELGGQDRGGGGDHPECRCRDRGTCGSSGRSFCGDTSDDGQIHQGSADVG